MPACCVLGGWGEQNAATVAVVEADLRSRLANSEAARIAQVQQHEAILSELRLDYGMQLGVCTQAGCGCLPMLEGRVRLRRTSRDTDVMMR